jgi:outer membrane protein assembly factor BamB
MKIMRYAISLSLFLVFTVAVGAQPATWSTYRGNAQRTASTDGQAGPAAPKILWSLKSKDHYIASPVPMGERLYVSGLGAFNLGNFACLSTEPGAKARVLWAKTTPLLKLPTVSSPGVFKNYLIFGDGMHQTNGALLYCLDADGGWPVWRHSVPGDLVHLEGSPAIVDGKAYIGGGAAGVLCVEIDKASVAGKEHDLPSLQKLFAVNLKELRAKYEIAKKTDPFAIPPSEDEVLKAEPKRLWQEGKDKLHVDAPVAVVGDKVLACSAFLDKEGVGDRALLCLDAKSGKVLWRTPLKLNPWGGPSVVGDTVIVTGGTISMDINLFKGAKGFIAAYDLKKGEMKWSKDIATGGVVSCAALAGNSAVVTATDGKVRAFAIDSGERQWIYDAKAPLFAPVAIARDVVYAGDLKGVLHAIDLKSGSESWKLDLGTHKEVQAPGMFYGGPIVHGGRLYAATCNLQGANAQKETVVVCVGEK